MKQIWVNLRQRKLNLWSHIDNDCKLKKCDWKNNKEMRLATPCFYYDFTHLLTEFLRVLTILTLWTEAGVPDFWNIIETITQWSVLQTSELPRWYSPHLLPRRLSSSLPSQPYFAIKYSNGRRPPRQFLEPKRANRPIGPNHSFLLFGGHQS